MPTIEFSATSEAPSARAEVPEGGRLLDIADACSAPVSFSCRSASCGTCRVDVLEGEALLEPPGVEEADVLSIFGDPPGRRLACSAQVVAGPGLIVLRVVAGD